MYTKRNKQIKNLKAILACGCKILEAGYETAGGKRVVYDTIEYCPKHKAADDMYEALKAFDDYLSAPYPENMRLKQIAVEKMDTVLAKIKAEGG